MEWNGMEWNGRMWGAAAKEWRFEIPHHGRTLVECTGSNAVNGIKPHAQAVKDHGADMVTRVEGERNGGNGRKNPEVADKVGNVCVNTHGGNRKRNEM